MSECRRFFLSGRGSVLVEPELPSSCNRLRVNVLVTLTPTPKRDGRPYYLIHKEYLREGGGVSTSSEQSALPPIGFPEPQTLNQHRRVFLFLLLPSPHDATTLF